MKKKLLGSFVPAAAGLMLLTPASAAEFSDLSSSQRFYEEMMYLEQEDVISGYPDGTFRPANEVTRAEATIMIGRSLGLEEAPTSSEFSDVGESVRASGYINELTERGIISGYPDGTFRPGKEVSRGEMAILLTRAFNFDEEAPYSFIDLNRNMASYDYVSRFLEANITYGYPDGTYRPAEGVSRADFSAFLARSLNEDFQEEPRDLTSYAREQSYTFTIEYYTTGEVDEITYAGIDSSGQYYLWENTDQFGETNQTIEYETVKGLHYGILNSEGVQVLGYLSLIHI